jgi:DNA-binding transcriptional regulator YiaG
MDMDLSDRIIPLRHGPSIKHLKPDNTSAKPDRHQVRVYRTDPEGINLQIWRGRSVATAYLHNTQAAELIAQLQSQVKHITENGKDMAARQTRARKRRRKPVNLKPKPIAEPDTNGMVVCARKRLGLTQVELADRIGVHKRTIMRWENGWPFPQWARLRIKELVKGV